jgi:acyl transferase domain-containing protein
MEPALAAFRERLGTITLHPPARRFISNLTGDWITADQATDPDYWVRHLRSTVRFGEGLGRLSENRDLALLEIGPGAALSSLARRRRTRGDDRVVVSSLDRPGGADEPAQVLEALGRLWAAGAQVDADGVNAGRGRRVRLPTYPFQRQRHWIDPDIDPNGDSVGGLVERRHGKRTARSGVPPRSPPNGRWEAAG